MTTKSEKSAIVKHLKLPGVVTSTYLKLPARMSYRELEETLAILGQLGRSVGWWVIDAILYAEDKLKEDQFSQIVEALGWNPHTMQNALSVGRAFPPSRRREALSLGHHEAVARLDKEDQEHWLDLAEEGDKLENGEQKAWSVSTLRKQMRALGPASSPGENGSESPTAALDTGPVLAEGLVVGIRWAAEGIVRYQLNAVSEVEGVLQVNGRRV